MDFFYGLIAVAIERFYAIDKWHKRFNWFNSYLNLVHKVAKGLPGWATVVIATVPVPFILAMIVAAFSHGVFHVFAFALTVLLVVYCLGPTNIFSQVHQGDGMKAEDAVIALNHNVVAVLFWYALLGVFGAVLYRCARLFLEHDTNADRQQYLVQVMDGFDWMPARLLGLVLALGGHFMAVFNAWMKQAFNGLDDSSQLLRECSRAALTDEEAQDGKAVAKLLDRTSIILAVIWGLIVLL
ncbi:MAG: membrane protein [marine bacterium B5-7]|nr:MAG: membrane protein [marine bacterium B5-7]